jgi:large subunit ribosomal protein L9
MEIILTEDVANLGFAGQILKVSPGYARNFLIPGNRALLATPHNLKALAKKREEFERRSRAAKDEALDLQKRLASLTVTIYRKSVEKGKLYGAVTPQDMVDVVKQEGIILERKRIKISEPIKTLGDYEIAVRIHPEVSGSFKLKVLPEAIPEPPAPPEDAKTDGKRGKKKARPPRPKGEEAAAPEAVASEAPQEAAPTPEAAPPAASPETPGETPPPEETPAS